MTADVKKEEPKTPERKIFSEARSRYTVVDVNKVYHFDFPATNQLEDNLSILTYMRSQLITAITEKDKKEAEKPKEEKEAPKETSV